MIDVGVYDFEDNCCLELSLGRHVICRDMGLKELRHIYFVAVLFVRLVVIDVKLALRMRGGFCFRIIVVELNFRCSKLDRHGGSLDFNIPRHL